jgi:hypothetical protein
VTAFLASVIGNLSLLIAVSVFFMAISYLATSGAVFAFRRKGLGSHLRMRSLLIPGLGILFSAYLISQCTPVQLAIGVLLLLAGVPIYVKYSPKKEIAELKSRLLSRENILKRLYAQESVTPIEKLSVASLRGNSRYS